MLVNPVCVCVLEADIKRVCVFAPVQLPDTFSVCVCARVCVMYNPIN